MQLFNTLNRKVEDIEPLNPPVVTVYTCGPTVYDYQHVGNWFTFIRYDLLIRTLKLSGFEPKWVINITDVGHLVSDADEGEDKLEKAAKKEGKNAWQIAEFYSNKFIDGLEKLNFTKADYLPKATEHIKEQVNLIKELEKKGFTYKINDGIYFDTSKFPEYKDFASLDIDELQSGKRVEFNPEKRNVSDFALWKFSPKDKKRDMEWDSPWGVGFPGWHLECSAMAMKYLGDTIDIHAGGIEHLPVHHTNEIAQSQGATGKLFAKYWMHTNHILLDGQKISKSLGNTLTLDDLSKNDIDFNSFRYLVLQSHYRSQSNFSIEIAENAKHSLKHLINTFNTRFEGERKSEDDSSEVEQLLTKYRKKISDELKHDLNTASVVALLHECADKYSNMVSNNSSKYIGDFNSFLKEALGISVYTKTELNKKEKERLVERQKARAEKDWEKSDKLRDELKKSGISLLDVENGVKWFRD